MSQAIRFLEYYCHLSSYSARNARFHDIDLSTITLTCGRRTYDVAFEPPMQTLKEARERLINLDQRALVAKGRSSVTVKKYYGPSSVLEVIVFAICVVTLIILSRSKNSMPGSWLYDTIFRFKPALAQVLVSLHRFSWLVLCLHIVEAAYMAFVKLSEHTVPVGSMLWWKWVASTFVDGIFSFRR